MAAFLTLDDVHVAGKRVGVRIDMNSAIVNGKIEQSERMVAHAQTLRELSEKKARVVVLAHQGRKGASEYRELDAHAKLLAKLVKKKVYYVNDLYGKKAVVAIRLLRPGEILVLKNVRSFAGEAVEKSPAMHAKSELVRTLQPLFDLYVQDAFSNAHRSHASMVGFVRIPNVAGRVMQKELDALAHVAKPKHPFVFLLGGNKPADVLELIEKMRGVDTFLVAGTLGELCAYANGSKLGKKEKVLQKRGEMYLVPCVKRILRQKKIVFPVDVAVAVRGKRMDMSLGKEEGILQDALPGDIGDETIGQFAKVLQSAKTVYVKGPMGMYEQNVFQKGTKKVLEAIARSKAFSLVGGGNTLSAMEMLVGKNKFSHVSVGGGALLAFLVGKKLPCLALLKKK